MLRAGRGRSAPRHGSTAARLPGSTRAFTCVPLTVRFASEGAGHRWCCGQHGAVSSGHPALGVRGDGLPSILRRPLHARKGGSVQRVRPRSRGIELQNGVAVSRRGIYTRFGVACASHGVQSNRGIESRYVVAVQSRSVAV